MSIQELVGQSIRRIRLARGMTQAALAHRSGVERSYVGKLERGESDPGLGTLQSLASALGTNLIDLLEPTSTLPGASVNWERPRHNPETTYDEQDYERIAHAVKVNVASVRTCWHAFDEAALWYRIRKLEPPRPGAKSARRGLPELPQASIQSAAPRASQREIKGRLERIEKAARKLLNALGVRKTDDPADGPGDWEVMEVLASALHNDEDLVIHATASVGDLLDVVVKAAGHTDLLKRAAKLAVQDQARLRRLIVPDSHRRALPVHGWIRDMAKIYRHVTGETPGTSVGASESSNAGEEGGPFIRFLQAAGAPLGIKRSESAWRSRIRSALRSQD